MKQLEVPLSENRYCIGEELTFTINTVEGTHTGVITEVKHESVKLASETLRCDIDIFTGVGRSFVMDVDVGPLGRDETFDAVFEYWLHDVTVLSHKSGDNVL